MAPGALHRCLGATRQAAAQALNTLAPWDQQHLLDSLVQAGFDVKRKGREKPTEKEVTGPKEVGVKRVEEKPTEKGTEAGGGSDSAKEEASLITSRQPQSKRLRAKRGTTELAETTLLTTLLDWQG